MANVKMEELARVQTVGPGGIGVYPPVPTEKVDKVSSAGLGKEELQRSANVLPHPGAVDDGAVMQEIDGVWSGGQGGGGGSADIDLGVTDASVGDYLKVKSVDEDGKPTAWESEPVDTETIVEATDAWLEENIAQETGYALDSSLTMSNAAAPADKVGELKTALDDIAKTNRTASGDYVVVSNPKSGDIVKQTFTNITATRILISKGNMLSLPYVRQSGYTQNGLTFTINDDYSITVNGTATADTTYNISQVTPALNVYAADRGYGFFMSGCTGGSTDTYYLYNASTGHKCANGTTAVFGSSGVGMNIAIVVKSGVTLNNQVFYPMISPIEDMEYSRPYTSASVSVSSSDIEYTWENLTFLDGDNYIYGTAKGSIEYSGWYYETLPNVLEDVGVEIDELHTTIDRQIGNIEIPVLRNGSVGNIAQTYAVCTQYVLPVNNNYDGIIIDFIGAATGIDRFAFSYCFFDGATDNQTSDSAFSSALITKYTVDNSALNVKKQTQSFYVSFSDYSTCDHFAVYLYALDANDDYVPLRIASDQYCLRITYAYADDEALKTANKNLLNSRHAVNNPLTLLHFSDIHADKGALKRILRNARVYYPNIDDIICTGDIRYDVYGEIASWWDESVMTCIGNHDTASESGGVYNWTALSMADRDAYYIAPFESNWGITHTSGTSYYYKDYTTQNLRLIVMDVMLYMASDTTQATVQTQWLADLLADAITNSIHVLIAIHAPHGGATAEDCSFTKYGATTMRVNSDCNTPQEVIDTVASAITSGLHFVGYLCGHTHQDYIWDAENNDKQLMYNVTCAIISNVSDQHRGVGFDAYNIVTVDTNNSLVKIVRGGGADIDDHMRTRKAICFDYSTGEKVGEVL